MPSKSSGPPVTGQHVRPCISPWTIRSKTWIEVEGQFAIGEGGAELLSAVEEYGSLTHGARRVGWSYRHAWGYIRRAEDVLGVALLATKPGKGSHRGAQLTDRARTLVRTLQPVPPRPHRLALTARRPAARRHSA